MGDPYVLVFHCLTVVSNLLALLLVLETHQRKGVLWCCLGVTAGGILLAQLGNRSGLPWLAYYSVPILVLSFLIPPLWFRMRRAQLAAYLGLRTLSIPLTYGLGTLLVTALAHQPFVTRPLTQDFESASLAGWSREFPHRAPSRSCPTLREQTIRSRASSWRTGIQR